MNKYDYIEEEDVLICNHSGKMNFQDAVQQFMEIQKHERYHDQIKLLRDFRGVALDFHSHSFDHVVDHSRGYVLTHGKVALLVNDALNTAFGMLFQQKVQNQPIELFNGLDAACEYLDLDINAVKQYFE